MSVITSPNSLTLVTDSNTADIIVQNDEKNANDTMTAVKESDQTVSSANTDMELGKPLKEDTVNDQQLDNASIQDAAANVANVVTSAVSESSPSLAVRGNNDVLPTAEVVPLPPVIGTVDREDMPVVPFTPLLSSTDSNASIAAATATTTATVAVLSAMTVALVSTATTIIASARKVVHEDEEHAQILAGIENHMQTAKLAHEHEQEAAQLLSAISFKVQTAKRNNEHEMETAQLLKAIRYHILSTYFISLFPPPHNLSTDSFDIPSFFLSAKVLMSQQEQEAARLLAAISAKVRAAKKQKEEEVKEDIETELQIKFARQSFEKKQHEEDTIRYLKEKAMPSASALAATNTLTMLDGSIDYDEVLSMVDQQDLLNQGSAGAGATGAVATAVSSATTGAGVETFSNTSSSNGVKFSVEEEQEEQKKETDKNHQQPQLSLQQAESTTSLKSMCTLRETMESQPLVDLAEWLLETVTFKFLVGQREHTPPNASCAITCHLMHPVTRPVTNLFPSR